MAGKSILSSTLFSQKKLVAKGHTAANKTDFSEGLSSAVQVGASFIFADNVPTTPDTNWNTQQYKLQGNVQMVEFDVEAVPGTNYRSSDVDTIGVQTGRIDSQNIVGTHGYRLKLKADYEQKTQEANGNNTVAGNGSHVDGKVLAESFGALQLVPVNFGTYNIAGISVYNIQFFSGPDDINDQIGSSDEIDYIVDYYSGLIFVQDVKVGYPTPVRARGFIYTGRMLSDRLTTVETGNDVGWLGPASGFISTTGSLGIGTSTSVSADAETLLGNLGSAIFNNQNRPGSDFVVNSTDKSAIKVDSDINQVLILSGGNENSTDEADGTDVAFFVSGSKNSRGTDTRGTAVFGGDVVVSGSLFDIDGNIIGGSAGIVQDSDGDTKIQVEEGDNDEDKIRFDTAGVERMVIDNLGNVGIGTDSPSEILHIASTGKAAIFVEADTDDGTETDTSYIKLSQDGGKVTSHLGFNPAGSKNPENEDYEGALVNALLITNENSVHAPAVQIGVGNVSLITAKSSNDGGKVGIGINSPTHKLDVNGDIRIRGGDIRDNSGNPAISMDGSANTTIVNDGVVGGDLSVGGTLVVGKSDPIAHTQLDVDGKIRASKFGIGSAYGFFGMPQYEIAELADVLFRADLRFKNYNSIAETQTYEQAAALPNPEITRWRAQIQTNRGNNLLSPERFEQYIDSAGMESVVNRRRSPTFIGTFNSDNLDDRIAVEIDSTERGRRAKARLILSFITVNSGDTVVFNVPEGDPIGGSGTFKIKYDNNPIPEENTITINLDDVNNANSDQHNLAQLTAFIINGVDPSGEERASGGGNYDQNWGVYASSGVGNVSNFTSGLDAEVVFGGNAVENFADTDPRKTTYFVDIFASVKGSDADIANNIQITNETGKGNIKTGEDDTPLRLGVAPNGLAVDTFSWGIISLNAAKKYGYFGYTQQGVEITGGVQTLGDTGVTVQFDRTTGFSLGGGGGGNVKDSWGWAKIRNDLPERLFNSDFDSRIEFQNGETHKLVIDMSGVRPYGVNLAKGTQGGLQGIVYCEGELAITYYDNMQNSNTGYRLWFASTEPESYIASKGIESQPGWKTENDYQDLFRKRHVQPRVNIATNSSSLVEMLKIGENRLAAIEITVEALPEVPDPSLGRIPSNQRAAITNLTYITSRPAPSVIEPAVFLKTRDNTLWGIAEFPSGSADKPTVSFRDGSVGNIETRSNTGIFMPESNELAISAGGIKKTSVSSNGLKIHSNDGNSESVIQTEDATGDMTLLTNTSGINLDSGNGVWDFKEGGVSQLKISTEPDANDLKITATNQIGELVIGMDAATDNDPDHVEKCIEFRLRGNAQTGWRPNVGVNFQLSTHSPKNILDILAEENDHGFQVSAPKTNDPSDTRPLVMFTRENVEYGRLQFFDATSVNQTQISTRPAAHTFFTTASYKGTDELGNETTTAATRFGIGTRTPESLFDVRGDGQNSQIFLLSGAMDENASNPTAYTDTSFFLSGSINSKNSATIKGTSVIGGDLVISGASYFEAISEAPSDPSAGSVAMYAKDVGGSANLFIKDSSGTELKIGSSNWDDGGDFVFPADNDGAESVVIGANNVEGADIILGADGSAEFNKQQQQDSNFVISSRDKEEAFKVTSDGDLVNIKSSTTTVTADTRVRLELTVASNQQGGGNQGGGNQGGGGQNAVPSTGQIQVLKAGEGTSSNASFTIIENPDGSGDYNHITNKGTVITIDDGLGTIYSKLEIEIVHTNGFGAGVLSNHFDRETGDFRPTIMAVPGRNNYASRANVMERPTIFFRVNPQGKYADADTTSQNPFTASYCRGQDYALTLNFTDRLGQVITIDFVHEDLAPVFANATSVLNHPNLKGQDGGFRLNADGTYSVGTGGLETAGSENSKKINYSIACCLLDAKERGNFAILGVSFQRGSQSSNDISIGIGNKGLLSSDNRSATMHEGNFISQHNDFEVICVHSDQFAGGIFDGVEQSGLPLSVHVAPHSSAGIPNWTEIPNPITPGHTPSSPDFSFNNAPFIFRAFKTGGQLDTNRINSRRSNILYYPHQQQYYMSNDNTIATAVQTSYSEFAVYIKNLINNHKIQATAEIDQNNSLSIKINSSGPNASVDSNAPADIDFSDFSGDSSSGFTPASFPRFTLGDGSITETIVIDGDANNLLLNNGENASTYTGAAGQLPIEDSQRGRIVIPTTTSDSTNAILTIYPTNAESFHEAHKSSSMITGADVVDASSILNMKITDQTSKSITVAFGSTSSEDIVNIQDELDTIVVYGDSETIYRVYQSQATTTSFYIHVNNQSVAANNEHGLAHAIYACVRHANDDGLIDINAKLMAKSDGTKSTPDVVDSNPPAMIDIIVLTVDESGFSGNASNLVFSDPAGIMSNNNRRRSISYGYDEAFAADQTGLRELDRHEDTQAIATNNQYLGTSIGSKIYFRQGNIVGEGAGNSLTAEQIATAVSEVINGSALSLSASVNGTIVSLTDSDGFNVQITSSNAEGLLTISGMNGGTQASEGGGGGGNDGGGAGQGNNQVHSVELTSEGFQINTNLLPSTDTGFSLGSPNRRFSDIYTGDLHLRNDRGDWTVIEEPEFLTITNNKTGKRFKLLMEPFE